MAEADQRFFTFAPSLRRWNVDEITLVAAHPSAPSHRNDSGKDNKEIDVSDCATLASSLPSPARSDIRARPAGAFAWRCASQAASGCRDAAPSAGVFRLSDTGVSRVHS